MPKKKARINARVRHDRQRGKKLASPLTNSRTEEREIIKDALRGNQAAFEKLMRMYHDAIYRLIYRMVREKAEVEDLTQETFIKAFASLRSFNNEFAFSTWLYKIARNNSIDYIRRKKLQSFSLDKQVDTQDDQYTYEVPDTTYQPDRPIIEKQRTKLIDEAINTLPEKYRRVIILRHKEERDYQDIARILRLPLGTVKAHIFRARELLKKYLRNKIQQF